MASADQISCRNLGRRSGRRPLRKAQASRRAAKRPRQRPRGMGGNRRKNHPQRGPPPRPPRQRLAKRKARKEQLVKFGFCPIPSECSTAYTVRGSAESPARAPAEAALTEQNGLAPRPAARQGAPRARNCAATSVFSFDGSTAVFFLGRQKENGGGIPAGDAPLPPCLGNEKREEAELPLSFVSSKGGEGFGSGGFQPVEQKRGRGGQDHGAGPGRDHGGEDVP